ncbi:carboxypeptidase regulatory-like domain-containing protein [Methanofollis fontis]|uniref:PEGA domain-containing protein n=1 Tax=Methanofollis fontis TaxID=2052832 RepID=A0A483CSG7_9EURY|nr:carboxypeptidase regulatory-like domain-containing protein [Methanofollis fontis]TAJ45284.1 hypothetical protein CUJ86_00605 [Methanofollis fontis]
MGNKPRFALLFVLIAMMLLVGAVQALGLTITVRDGDDNAYVQGASIYVDGAYEGITDSYGEFYFYHTYDSRFSLRVVRSGYEDWSDTIDEDDTSVTVLLEPDTVDLEVVVYDADSIEPISGAWIEILAGGGSVVESGRTNSLGLASFDVDAEGEYVVEIEADDYEGITRDLEMDGEARTVQFWLYPTGRFAFRVLDAQTSDPIANATITVGGTVRGTTGSEGTLATVLDLGRSYLVGVTHPSYREYAQEVYIAEDSVVTDVFLSKSTYPLFISVFDTEKKPIEGATVTVDGSVAGTTDAYGRFSLGSVVAGSHAIGVSADGYASWQGTCTSFDQKSDIVAELAPIPVPVSVLAEDSEHRPLQGAAVAVDGVVKGSTAVDGSIALSLTPGVYNISASHEGYRTAYLDRQIAVGSSGESLMMTLDADGIPLWILGAVAGVLVVAVIVVPVVLGKAKGLTLRRKKPGRRSF